MGDSLLWAEKMLKAESKQNGFTELPVQQMPSPFVLKVYFLHLIYLLPRIMTYLSGSV